MSNAFDKASLVMLPHAYEEGKLYSLKPTDRSGDFTFSRGADTATRVNEQGYIEVVTDLNAPRLDYSGGATCPSLLLEPQRTNLVTQSEYLEGSGWTRSGVTLTSNAAISPSGLNDATLVTNNVTNQKHIVPTVSITDNTNYSYSVFVKKGNDDNYKINVWNSTYSEALVGVFDFSNPQSLTITDNVTGGSYLDSDVKDFRNGWYRIELSFTSFDTSLNIRNYIGTANGTDNSTMYYYGFQLEAGSYPTSYIPTYGSAQTRPVEDASNTNTIDADNDFTFYFESTLMAEYFTDKYFNSTIFGYLSGYNISGNNLRHRFGGTNYTFIASEGIFKYLIRKDSTNMKIYLNGTLERTITTLPTGTGDLNLLGGKVHKTLYFPEALSDSECIALTTIV